MAADDVARALMALDDSSLRERVRSGDPDALSAWRLTSEEAELVRNAASDDNEVLAFSLEREGSGAAKAADYVRGNIADPALADQFGSWFAKGGGNWLQAGGSWYQSGG